MAVQMGVKDVEDVEPGDRVHGEVAERRERVALQRRPPVGRMFGAAPARQVQFMDLGGGLAESRRVAPALVRERVLASGDGGAVQGCDGAGLGERDMG